MSRQRFAAALISWFAVNARQLPWRGTRDPYRIWLSEIILQQTRVAQGSDYYLRFIDRWPTVAALAAADEDEVMRMWQGLGYYSRARNLHAAARQVVELGGFPTTVEGLRGLKGVGPYTAAAIGSMAFDLPAAVVDGNVYRVLARHFGIDTPINTTEGQRLFAALAADLLPPARAAIYNQAIMDFGATVCTPAAPDCDQCPLADTCVALDRHTVGRLPVKLAKTKVRTRRFNYVVVVCRGFTALRRRPAGDIWQGLYEPPLYESDTLPRFDAPLTLLQADVRHQLTHRTIIANFYLLNADSRPDLPEEYFWVPLAEVDRYAKSRLVERLFAAVGNSR